MVSTCRYEGSAIAAAELRFREDLWRAAPKDAVEEAEIRHRRFGPVLATVFGVLPDVSLMNSVHGAAEPGAVEDGHLAEAIEWVRSWEVGYRISISADRPGTPATEAWLGKRGYERAERKRRFVHPGTDDFEPLSSRVDVHELGALETEGMSHIFGAALGLSTLATILLMGLPGRDGWHCYRGSLDGREVACGSMLILGKVALLGLDATLPDERGNGCQLELIKRRLADATRAGCDVMVAEVCDGPPASPSAVRNLQLLGFEEIPGALNWRRPSGIA